MTEHVLLDNNNHQDLKISPHFKAEFGDKVPESDKSAIESEVTALREALEGEDTETIKTKTESLSQAAMKLGEAMYKAQQGEEGGADAGADASAGSGQAQDDVVDADFEEVDDDKKDK